MQVIKSSGITQEFNPEKIKNVLKKACLGTSYDYEKLYDKIKNNFEDMMTTNYITKQITTSIASLISLENYEMDLIAGRSAMMALRKSVYGTFTVPDLYSIITENVKLKLYDPILLESYSKEEIDELNNYIDHNKDFEFKYAGAMQVIEKYLVQDRSTNKIYETPQTAYICQGLFIFSNEEKSVRLNKIKKYYDVTSSRKLSLPTPILAGARTPTRQFSSCCVIDSGDSLQSINDTSNAIVNYISKRAGIGVNGGRIRAEGSKIRSGEVKHTGVIPFWKHFHTAVKSCSQGGVRGGSATISYPLWHLEVEKLLVLKNNKGIEETRIRHMDYSVAINDLMFERLINDDYITLFSPDVLNGSLYHLYYSDSSKFKEFYEKAEKDPKIRKQKIKAKELFSIFIQERSSTGRIYPIFNSNIINQNKFLDPIFLSNLCLEIALPTTPLYKDKGEIALCILSAINIGEIDDLTELEEICYIAVNVLDNLIDIQDYPVKQAKEAIYRRSLGIGITNFAYYLAKNYVKYSDDSANELTHKLAESMQYYLLKASNKLAQEKGACEYFHRTKYSQGLLPIDLYEKNVDSIINIPYEHDWEELRTNIKQFGLRNSVVSAQMPCESSSQVTNSTNGLEPPRSLSSIKKSKDGPFKQLVPEANILSNEYETSWEMSKIGMKGYLDKMAIIQKFFDQSISSNTYYDPEVYENRKIPIKILLEDLIYSNWIGLKTLYYQNINDGQQDDVEETELDCESCKI